MKDTSSWLTIARDREAAGRLLSWWTGLEHARGDRAELRRCHDIVDLGLCEGYHRLRLALEPHGRVDNRRLAVVAGVLSHLREHDGSAGLPAQMARRAEGTDRARVSGLRFKRLLAVEQADALLGPLTRVVRLLRGRANAVSLAEGVLGWGQGIRTCWAYDYYDKASTKEA